MATDDTMCTIVPYFEVQDGKIDEFKALGDQMVEVTKNESDVLFYGFSFDGNRAFCREGYTGAEGVLAHLKNVGKLLGEALAIAELKVFEIHGPESELAKLKGPIKDMKLDPVYYVLEAGFRR